MKKILILTNSQDGEHTDSVINHLLKLKAEYFRLDVDRFAKGEITIEMLADSKSFSFCFYDGPKEVFSTEIGSVWYRRPWFFESPIEDKIQREHIQKEIEKLLEGLWQSMSGVFWLNKPTSLEITRKKLSQLQLASSTGFNVPRTMVTNNPNKARQFINSCNSGAIYKTINDGFFDYGDKQFITQTTLVTPNLIDKLDLVRVSPSLFQERVEKDYELRITVVGKKIFPIRINSQKFLETSLDWRHPEFVSKLDYKVVDLPNELTQKILQMMDSLDLSFGAFDFAVDKKGDEWFFEVNGNGQWYWLEYETGALISKSIADKLFKGTINSSERR